MSDDQSRKIPTHEIVYARLRDMILFGVLQPGQPVTIQGLIQELDAGMTPVREAIRRLAAEGALLPKGNRRVAVPQLTPDLLDQIAFARLTIEPRLAQMATTNLTPDLIERLDALDKAVNDAIAAGDVPAYLESNHAFHFAVYEASGASVLIDIARSLWLQYGPSLRIVVEQGGDLGQPDRHAESLTAMRAGDAQALARAFHNDIAQGIAHVRQAMTRGRV